LERRLAAIVINVQHDREHNGHDEENARRVLGDFGQHIAGPGAEQGIGGAGAEGQAVSLVSHEEMDQLRGIQRLIKTDMDFALVAGF